MNYSRITKSQEIIRESLSYYLSEMEKLHLQGYEDETASDIEDWSAFKYLIYCYMNNEKDDIDKDELLYYFGDEERVNLVLSYFRIAKYLLDSGINLNL